MSSQIKPIQTWGHGGPNPKKVIILLEAIGIPYDINVVPFNKVKEPEYVAINPNGRLPSMQDPNTGITVWESGAIVEYLVERYDTNHQLSFAPGTPEYYHAKQWLFFQVSGQGPYYGQAVWFKGHHHENLPSAAERYVKEINRVCGVLGGHLAKQKHKFSGSANNDGPWLVGNKLSYADLAFIPWQQLGKHVTKVDYDVDNYPDLKDWLERMLSREAVKKGVEYANSPELKTEKST